MSRWILIMPLLLTGFLAGCSGAPASKEAAPAKNPEGQVPKDAVVLTPAEQATGNIETQVIGSTDAPDVLRLSGRIVRADDRTWRIGVRTDGLVRNVLVNLGDAVRKDQVLARYHADEVREGRAKYHTAAADVQKLEAAAAQARRNLDRMQGLLDLKAASVMQVEQARQDMVVAETALKNGRTEVERVRDLLEDDLRVPADPAPGQPDVDEVPIVAPAAGVILEKNVTPGRTIAPGQDAFVISDLTQVWMLASVRQDSLDQLHTGQAADVTIQGLEHDRFVGRVTNLGQEVDPATRVVQIRIVVSNTNHRLRPEMLATAAVALDRKTTVLTVPSDAVQQVNGQDIVFVRTAADRFTMRPVRIGATLDGRTPVLEGLKAGEQVVVRGSFTLKSHLLRSSMEGE